MKLPTITPKQQEILKLLYRYRFLERKQIQAFLKHKDKRQTARWLKELREQEFIDWFYDTSNPVELSKPAIHFLSLNGIRFMRDESYPEAELRKRYKDGERQSDFIARCLLLANCGLHLESRNRGDAKVSYEYALEADYANPDNDYSFLNANEYIHPQLVFTKEEDADGSSTRTYLVELFDITTPRYMVKKRVKGYVEYLASDEWEKAQQENSELSDELPIVLIACPTLSEMIYAKRYARRQLDDMWDDKVPEEVKIWVSTIGKVRAKGVTSVIWEDC
jgi:hypothetical protein